MKRAYICCWCGKLFPKREERDNHAEECDMKTKCAKCGVEIPNGLTNNFCVTCQIDYINKLTRQGLE